MSRWMTCLEWQYLSALDISRMNCGGWGSIVDEIHFDTNVCFNNAHACIHMHT